MNYLCSLLLCGWTGILACSWGKTRYSLACSKYLSRSARCRSTAPGCLVRSHTVWRWNRAEHNQGYTQTAPRSPPQSHCQGASQSVAQGRSCTAWSWSSGQLQERKEHFKRIFSWIWSEMVLMTNSHTTPSKLYVSMACGWIKGCISSSGTSITTHCMLRHPWN